MHHRSYSPISMTCMESAVDIWKPTLKIDEEWKKCAQCGRRCRSVSQDTGSLGGSGNRMEVIAFLFRLKRASSLTRPIWHVWGAGVQVRGWTSAIIGQWLRQPLSLNRNCSFSSRVAWLVDEYMVVSLVLADYRDRDESRVATEVVARLVAKG